MALNINGTTGISGVDGSASAPALQGSDSNTGVSFGSDTVNINTGGTTRATVDSSGNLNCTGSVTATGTSCSLGTTTIKGGSNTAARLLLQNTTSVRTNFIGLSSDDDTIVISADDADQGSNSSIEFKVDGSERMRINSSGNLGINDTSPTAELSVAATAPHIDLGVAGGVRMKIGYEGNNCFFGGTHAGAMFIFKQGVDAEGHPQASGSEVMRLDNNGDVGIGTTDPGNADSADGGLQIQPNHSNGAPTVHFKRANNGSTSQAVGFVNGSTGVGSITYTNGGTAFNTSSDYRLKENINPISDGITRLKTLKPYRFNFKVDADKTVDGFLAHEVSSIVPEAITGEKDAVDSNDKPIYQGIDQGKLVPLLTAALQEAIAKIETLETKVAALEVG